MLSSALMIISAAIYINLRIFHFYLFFVLSVFLICYRQSLVDKPPCMHQLRKKYIPQVGAKIKIFRGKLVKKTSEINGVCAKIFLFL